MRKIVVKFGGSNLRTPSDIDKIAAIALSYARPLVIVVSAFYGMTNDLVACLDGAKDEEAADEGLFTERLRERKRGIIEANVPDPELRRATLAEAESRIDRLDRYLTGVRCIGDVPGFVNDAILSQGERLSSLILTAALRCRGVDCEEILPEDLGLATDGEFGNATCDFGACEAAVAARLAADRIFVVPGFYGIGPDGKATLFGRGGSDYSAAAIARCVRAESLDLWKDVCGFLSADPGTVARPRRIERLSYLEAAELSYFGAKILHPRTVEPIFDLGIPLRVMDVSGRSVAALGTIAPGPIAPGTVIDGQRCVSDGAVKAVTSSEDIGILKLHGPGVGFKRGILAKATGVLDERGINIKSVITAQTAIDILLGRADLEKARSALREHHVAGVVDVTANDDLAIVALVGEGILEPSGGPGGGAGSGRAIAARALSAAAAGGIHVAMASVGASEVAMYILVRRDDRARAVRLIHEEFFGGEA
ncbi:MAG: aspartate kinase [Spirochaetaceae bacterium]|nr:aspartate kinase [Spirochaetaceae bacterium]